MRHLGMPDLHGDIGQSESDVADPVLTAECGEGLGDGLVEGFCRHVERMLSFVQVVDDDGCRF